MKQNKKLKILRNKDRKSVNSEVTGQFATRAL